VHPVTVRCGDRVEHFDIFDELGHGGMGQVYLARDTRLERLVALKIMRSEAEMGEAVDPRAGSPADRLLREARAAAGLEHPNIVTVYEVGEISGDGEAAGRPFIAMEYVKGRSLAHYVGDDEIPLSQRMGWLVDVARALSAAHAQGVVHRDIKPDNIMIREDGVVKVLDFGLAKRASLASHGTDTLRSITGEGMAVGTPAYMAPEQMLGEPLDGRADQFSWGTVAYELLAGKLPWGDDVEGLTMLSRLLVAEPPALATVNPEIAPAVAACVMRALSKSKDERFASMEELLAAMNVRASADESAPHPAPMVAEVPPTRRVPVVQGRTRRGRAFTLGLAALIAVGAAFSLRPWFERSFLKSTHPAECAHHADCVKRHGGQPFVCQNLRCVAVESEQCHASFEASDLERDDTIWLGALFPSKKSPMVSAMELARRELVDARATLRPTAGAPPLALVACDDSDNGAKAAHHLVDELGVPAVVGFANDAEAFELSRSVLVPRQILTLAAAHPSPLFPSLEAPGKDGRLLWSTTADTAVRARAIAAFIARKEADMRRREVVGASETVRVALVHPRGTSSTSFAEAFFGALEFNGKPAVKNEKSYAEFSYDEKNAPAEFTRIATELAAFGPYVVVTAAGSELVSAVESALPREAFRPVYIANVALEGEFAAAARGQEWRRRTYGVAPLSTTNANARFVLRYNETAQEPIAQTTSLNSAYDAFYLAAYAAYALGADKPTGGKLAKAMSRLMPPAKTSVDVGPLGVAAALGALQRGESIDLNGTTGSLDFDVKTGHAPVDLAIVCLEEGSKGVRIPESGLIYRASEGALDGDFLRCR
jgi:ABC-type branched-subunit amino acid transport system substrate-binding protein